ncbi:MAG: L-methionine (R)-S-oxide reductase, partial [Lentisphaeria bacterium]
MDLEAAVVERRGGKTSILVDDVDQFPGHIACASESRSEIVVPIHAKNGKVAYVLD